jgi:hypothetical protein
MKKLIQIFLPFFIISSQVFAIAGFGLNLNQTMFSVDAKTNAIGTVGSYGYDAISGGIGLGGYLYIDAIPFVDLDLEFSGFGTNYDYLLTISGNSTTYSLPYGSFAGYLTLQKKVLKLSIPILAKAKLTVGAGLNNQTYKSVPDQSDLETFIGSGLTSSSTAPTTDAFIEFVKENTDSANGFHIQTGIQFKLLMLDSFLYYRQVFADNVILDGKGFGSLNLRLGMGF